MMTKSIRLKMDQKRGISDIMTDIVDLVIVDVMMIIEVVDQIHWRVMKVKSFDC